MTKAELVELIKENFYNEKNNFIDLRGLKFDCGVSISQMEVNGDLFQNNHKVDGDISQWGHEVGGLKMTIKELLRKHDKDTLVIVKVDGILKGNMNKEKFKKNFKEYLHIKKYTYTCGIVMSGISVVTGLEINILKEKDHE